MFPMDRKALRDNPVRIEYDSIDGRRVTNELPNAYKARQFYARMLKAHRRPKVVGS